MNKTTSNSNIGSDIWFSGKGEPTESGGISYFICEYLDTCYYDEKSKNFIVYCKYKKKELLENECHADCDPFGRCSTCRGFSAIRCQECTIIKPSI